MGMNHGGQSLRARVLLVFLVGLSPIVVLLIAVLEGMLVPYVESRTMEELGRSTRLLADALRASASTAIRNHLRAIAEQNRAVAAHHLDLAKQGVLPREEAVARIEEILLSQRVGTSGYVYCINSDGMVEVHPEPGVLHTDASDFGFVQEQLRLKEGYIEYDWRNPDEPEERAKALYMVYFEAMDWIISVSSYKSEFSELLEPRDFRDAVLALRFGQGGYSYVFDEQGEALIHPEVEGINVFEQTDVESDFAREMRARGAGTIKYAWRNPDDPSPRLKIAAFDTLPEYGWTIASSAYWSDVMAPVVLVRWVGYGSILLLLVTAVLTAYAGSRWLTRPVDAMVRCLDRNMRDGVYDPMPIAHTNELGKLARGFNAFMAEIEAQNETLRRERARYLSLFECSPDAIFLLRGMTMVDCNTATSAVFGGEKKAIVGLSVLDLSLPQQAGIDTSARAEAAFECAYAGAELQTFEWEHKRLDGTAFDAEVRLKPFGKEGDDLLLVAFVRDITAHKKDEAELRRLRNYLASIIDSMPSALIGLDEKGCVTQWNAAAERAAGRAADEVLGQPLQEVFPRLAKEMNRVFRAMSTGDAQPNVRHSYRSNGELLYEEVAIYPLAAEGVDGAVMRVDDVTERARMEEMMLQSEKMLSVGGLAAGMAHEINNPLGGMLQTARVIEDRLTSLELQANRDAAQAAGIPLEAIQAYMEARGIARMLEQIRESGNRAADIVRNMLSFARRGGDDWEPQDLGRLLDRCVDLAGNDYDLKKRYDFKQIRIVRKYEESVPSVSCEAGKVQQVFLNLLRNGAEAMWQWKREHNEMEPCFVLRLMHEKALGMVRIDVEDNGPGMPENARKRVFEPFFTTKPVDSGTGLGLSVSYFIIVEHFGGEMHVETQPGEGTRFIVRLPVKSIGPAR